MTVAAFSVGLSLLGVFMYMDYRTSAENSNNDKKSFCRNDVLPSATVILIDHTDRIDAIQKASLERRLWDVASAVEKNGNVKVFSVDSVRDSTLLPDIDLCNPGSAQDVSEWTGNKRLSSKHYEEQFKKPINAILDKVFVSQSANQSPIMEALQSVAVTSFIGNKNNSESKKIILVSDLLEHTDDFSIYTGVPQFETYKMTPHWASVKSDLSGVNVEIFFLHRAGAEKIQTKALREFWINFFKAQGAVVIHFIPIEGKGL